MLAHGDQGYLRAKRLLHEHFGNEYNLSTDYVKKVLNWQGIKSEVPKTLNDFALYLRACCNVMAKLDYMDELNTASTLRAIVLKLPYKLRDKWQTKVQEKLESNSKITFTEHVQLIEKKVEICFNPVFENIQERLVSKSKMRSASKPSHRPKPSSATNVVALSAPVAPDMNSDVKLVCLCCDGAHSMEYCPDFK